MIGKSFLLPYLRPFPIWKYGEVHDFLTGVPTGDWAWQPNWYGQWEFPTQEDAEQRVAEIKARWA